MTSTPVIRIALPTPLRRLFDYLPPQGLDLAGIIPGIRVRVPFGKRMLIGVVVGVENKSNFPYEKLKCIEAVLDDAPILPEDVQKLCDWAAGYYQTALGEVYATALPAVLRKGENPVLKPVKKTPSLPAPDAPRALNADQANAVSRIVSAQHLFQVFLLDGVTGSGKTEVYLQAMTEVLNNQQQVLVLLPEISLTPQTVDRFRARFQVPVVALHSGLTDLARYRGWLAAKSGEASIVIGTRSAIFTAFNNLGLIIVDEEHDASFKQQDRFRYHARDLAVMRAHQANIPLVLGSATPSLESLSNVKRGRYQHLILNERAGGAVLPTYHIIDMKRQSADEGLSNALMAAMKDTLAAGDQVMLFLNRRGFSPVCYCDGCGWIAACERCDARLVMHRKPARLQCHHCDARKPLPETCENCGGHTLKPVGLGTQRLEESLKKHFPDVPIIRVDRDSTRTMGAMEALLKEMHDHPSAILLGTQMLAKGHHFPNVTLVGMVDADNGLFSPDFRAPETMGQLLMQVAGRAGRADKPGRVLIQTKYPEHPLITDLLQQGYRTFAMHLLSEREEAFLPPFSYMAVLRAEAYAEKTAHGFLNQVKQWVDAHLREVQLLGPVPASMAKRKGLYGQQLLIRAGQRPVLQAFLKQLLDALESKTLKSSVKWVLDVDPIEVG